MLVNQILCESLDKDAGRSIMDKEGEPSLVTVSLSPSEWKESNIINSLPRGGLTVGGMYKIESSASVSMVNTSGI